MGKSLHLEQMQRITVGADKKKLEAAPLSPIPLVQFLNVKSSALLEGKHINMYNVCASV